MNRNGPLFLAEMANYPQRKKMGRKWKYRGGLSRKGARLLNRMLVSDTLGSSK